MLTLIQNQHGRKVQEIEEIKGHEKIRFDSINSPFPQSQNSNNTKPKPIKPITQEPLRMEFIDGFVQYLVNNRIENVLVIPTIQSSNSWTCKETLSALGLAWLEFAKPMHHISNPFNSIIHVMGGNDQKAKQIVPGLFIETLSSKNTDLEKLISSLKLSLNSNDSVSSKGTTAKRSAEEHQDQPKRIKFSEFKRKSLTEDGQVSMVSSDNSTSNASKLQKPYLIWDKYLPAPAPSYPSSSLGALLQEPNSVNSRSDFHGRQ